MLETLFKYSRILARHRGGPAAEERERFLIQRANQGAARSTLLRTARDLLIIAKNIDAKADKAIGIHDLEVLPLSGPVINDANTAVTVQGG